MILGTVPSTDSQCSVRETATCGVSGAACLVVWAIFLPATVVCAIALGYKANAAKTITLPNLLVWSAGLVLVLLQALLLIGVTCRYLRGRRDAQRLSSGRGLQQRA